MKILLTLLRKEFRQIFRDKAILKLIFLMPTIQLLILPFAADSEIKNINVGIIDNDHSSYSRQLVEKMEYSSYFDLKEYSNSYKEGLKWLENNSVDLFIEIPANFESKLVRENYSPVFMAVNATNGVKGNLGAAYVMNTIADLNKNIIAEWVMPPSTNMSPQIDITHSHWYNPHSNYQKFMVPGILAILLTLVGSFLSALNIVREKEIGTIEQLNVTPILKSHFILGKLIPFWVLGYGILTIGLAISYIIHGIVPSSNIGVLFIFAGVYLIAVMGLGLLISNFSETQQQAMMISFFFMMVFIMLSGLFTSIESMPRWAQIVAWINPVTYMVDVMRMVLLKGAQLTDMLFHFKAIIAEAFFLNILAIWSYSKRN